MRDGDAHERPIDSCTLADRRSTERQQDGWLATLLQRARPNSGHGVWTMEPDGHIERMANQPCYEAEGQCH